MNYLQESQRIDLQFFDVTYSSFNAYYTIGEQNFELTIHYQRTLQGFTIDIQNGMWFNNDDLIEHELTFSDDYKKWMLNLILVMDKNYKFLTNYLYGYQHFAEYGI